jgi:hypothetical protein
MGLQRASDAARRHFWLAPHGFWVPFGPESVRGCSLGRDGKDIDTVLAPWPAPKRTATRPTPVFQQSLRGPGAFAIGVITDPAGLRRF